MTTIVTLRRRWLGPSSKHALAATPSRLGLLPRPSTAHLPSRPWLEERQAMLLGYQTGGQTSTGALPSDPRKRWRCFFVDEVDHVAADPAADWATADNYNPGRPFNAIDHVAVAISP